jgi:predicted RNA-binding protein YlqC (UPF0109 family)
MRNANAKKEQLSPKEVHLLNIAHCLRDALSLIVQHPDRMSVTCTFGERTIIYEVDVAKEDFGRLLGVGGKNINAFRTILASMAGAVGERAIIQIKDQDRFY